MSPRLPWLAPLLLATACASAPLEPWQKGDAAVGRQVARDMCGSCHAVERIGASPNPSAPPFRNILWNYPPEWLAEDLHNSITIAHQRMPTFYFGEGHEYDLVAYIRSIQDDPNYGPFTAPSAPAPPR